MEPLRISSLIDLLCSEQLVEREQGVLQLQSLCSSESESIYERLAVFGRVIAEVRTISKSTELLATLVRVTHGVFQRQLIVQLGSLEPLPTECIMELRNIASADSPNRMYALRTLAGQDGEWVVAKGKDLLASPRKKDRESAIVPLTYAPPVLSRPLLESAFQSTHLAECRMQIAIGLSFVGSSIQEGYLEQQLSAADAGIRPLVALALSFLRNRAGLNALHELIESASGDLTVFVYLLASKQTAARIGHRIDARNWREDTLTWIESELARCD